MSRTRRWPLVAIGGVALLLGCGSDKHPQCPCEPASPAIVTVFADEGNFVSRVAPIEPVNAPFSALTDSIVVGDGHFTIKPASGADKIAASNNVSTSLPSDVAVVCECYSNLDVAFRAPVSGFGFGVASWTAAANEGTSDFVVTLYHDGIVAGSARFSAPAAGECFFALLSAVRFDALTLRETGGAPQAGPGGRGAVDSECFGNFYVVP